VNFHGKNVVLRAIERVDLSTLHKWANDPDIWHMLGGWHFPGSMAAMERWFEGLQNEQLNQRFAIETIDFGLIGTTNLIEIDWKNNHAFHGVMLGEKDLRGKGYGTDAVMATMRYAFEELHMERLDSSIIEYNESSLKLYLGRCGWKEEGRRRNWYFRKNRYWDSIIVGITRQEYFELLKTSNYWK